MKTVTKVFSPTGTTETLAFDLKVQEHSSQTWEFFATAATIKVRIKSVFTDPEKKVEVETSAIGSGATLGALIQEIDLAQDTLTIVNFPFKLEHVRCTFDDDGTGDMAGSLLIKATTAK